MDKTVIRVLHFSTHHEDCGIGKYQEMFLEAMQSSVSVENKFFDVSPNQIRHMDTADKLATFESLKRELRDYDILHVQHEFSFYRSDEFKLACQAAKECGKKLIVTIHTSPNVAYHHPHLNGYGPHSVMHYLRERKKEAFFTKNFAEPLQQADLVLVHNDVTKAALVARGVSEGRISEITIPVPEVDLASKTTEIAEKLHVQKGDVVYATTGFLHQFKGIDHAIKALAFLPSNYKLAIIGGMHQDHQHHIYNNLTDLIHEWGLMDRVYITGYVADDDRLNALIRECDVCVYPYEKEYYSNVSSAALNNAFANHKPVVAYPTASFKQLTADEPYMVTTQSFSYYELARELQQIDLASATAQSEKFAQVYSYHQVANHLASVYQQLAS